MQTDVELLRAVADGDTGALRVLHERHSAWLTVRLLRRCNDRGLVAEVLQDTFVGVWRGAGSFRGEGKSPDGCGGWPSGDSWPRCGPAAAASRSACPR